MPLIRIDRSSIKKNPDAGNEFTTIAHPAEATFEYEGEWPAEIKDGQDVYITEYCLPHYGGDIIPPIDKIKLKRLFELGFKVNLSREVQTFQHLPAPDYLYQYENPLVTCSECQHTFPVNEIETEDYDGIYFNQCPHCSAVDSFGEIVYEKIEDALKDVTN
jgi:hypothetical protein